MCVYGHCQRENVRGERGRMCVEREALSLSHLLTLALSSSVSRGATNEKAQGSGRANEKVIWGGYD